jgi:hypothetical protein
MRRLASKHHSFLIYRLYLADVASPLVPPDLMTFSLQSTAYAPGTSSPYSIAVAGNSVCSLWLRV